MRYDGIMKPTKAEALESRRKEAICRANLELKRHAQARTLVDRLVALVRAESAVREYLALQATIQALKTGRRSASKPKARVK